MTSNPQQFFCLGPQHHSRLLVLNCSSSHHAALPFTLIHLAADQRNKVRLCADAQGLIVDTIKRRTLLLLSFTKSRIVALQLCAAHPLPKFCARRSSARRVALGSALGSLAGPPPVSSRRGKLCAYLCLLSLKFIALKQILLLLAATAPHPPPPGARKRATPALYNPARSLRSPKLTTHRRALTQNSNATRAPQYPPC